MEKPLLSTEIEIRYELERIGIVKNIKKHTNLENCDLLNDPRWQAKVERKQCRTQIDRSYHFISYYGDLFYNPRDDKLILNATNNPLIKSPDVNPTDEYHIIHKL